MKWRKLFGWKWFLPIVTMLIVLTAIVLPERLSALGDRKLFVAAHVEPFDSALDTAASVMSLVQRIKVLAALNFGEKTDAYLRYEDSFTQEEQNENDRVFLTTVDTLAKNGVLPLQEGFSLENMERGYSQRLLLWDNITMEEASFLQMSCYDATFGGGIDLTVDEASGQVVIMTVYSLDVETYFAGDDGRKLIEIGTQFLELLGFTVTDVKYGADDAYLFTETEDGALEYHISQKYDVLHIEAMPDTSVSNEMQYDADYETSVSVSVSGSGTEVYIK